jgi:hypothetical protein
LVEHQPSKLKVAWAPIQIGNWQPAMVSFGLFVTSMLAATATEFAEFQTVGRGLLILGRHVVPTLTLVTLKHNVVSRHNLNP